MADGWTGASPVIARHPGVWKDPLRSDRNDGSESHARERLRGLYALDRPDLRDDQLADRVVGIGFDLRDQIVLPEQRIQLDDVLDLRELLVDFLLPRGFDVDQDESDGRESSPCFLRTSVL